MINYRQELWEDLEKLRDKALTMKRLATDILEFCHVIETDMQSFIEDRYPPEQLPPVFPFEPGSPCIDPDGEGCRCYEGCTADCLPTEYQSCKCPRKVVAEPQPEPEEEPLYTLTDKGRLIAKLINDGYKYPDACRIAEAVYD